MEKIRCRDAKSRDCVVISELFKKMWDEVRPNIPLQDKAVDSLIDELVKSVNLPNMYLKVAEHKGKIIGFIFGSVSYQRRLNKLAGYCYDVFIEKEFRHTKLAYKMIEDNKEWGRKQGATIGFFVVQNKDIDRWVRRPDYDLYQTTFSCDLVKESGDKVEVI
jgi:GNAT superfamily N-acetyltransferase